MLEAEDKKSLSGSPSGRKVEDDLRALNHTEFRISQNPMCLSFGPRAIQAVTALAGQSLQPCVMMRWKIEALGALSVVISLCFSCEI